MGDETSDTDWAQLVCVTDTDSPPFVIGKDKFSIGRSKACDICHENNKLVSSTHCFIERDQEGKVWLCDTSTNGTLLNSTVKLNKGQRQEIEHGSEFYIIHKKGEEDFNIGYVFQDLAMLKEEEEQDSGDLDQTVEYEDGPPLAEATIVDDGVNEVLEADARIAVKRSLPTTERRDSEPSVKRTKTAPGSQGAGERDQTTETGSLKADHSPAAPAPQASKLASADTAKEGVGEKNRQQEECAGGEAQEEEKDDVFAETLTCIICQELLHDCISLQPCMHSFCAGCYSGWMAHSSECPSCRSSVDRINKNHIVNNLVDAYLKEHPEKRRPEQDLKDLDASNKITRDMLYPKKQRRSSSDYEDSDDVDDDNDDGLLGPVTTFPGPANVFGLGVTPMAPAGTIFGFGTPLFGTAVNAYKAVCRQCPGQKDSSKSPGIIATAIGAVKGMLTGNKTEPTAAATTNTNTTATASANAKTPDQPSTSGVAATTTASDHPSTGSASTGADEEEEQYVKRDLKIMPTPPPYTCAANQNHVLCQCCLHIFPDRRIERLHNPDVPPQQCTICYRAFCHAYWGCQKADCSGCLAKFQDMRFGKKVLPGLILGNKFESEVFMNYLESKRLAVHDVLQACLAKMVDGSYTCLDQVRYNLTGETPLCFACALRNFKSLAYQYRADIPRDQLPVEVTSRPDCYWGKNCRTQLNKPQHATRFNHVCEQTRT